MFTIMYHSLLIGAALFVPIPFLDDRLASFLWRHMILDLAKLHKRSLTQEQLLALSYQSRWALSDGCLFVGKRLFKEFFQEILFFLEWRKAINLAADAYYTGYMLNKLFAQESFDPTRSARYAMAMQKARLGLNVKLMQGVFRATFKSGRGVLTSIVKWLSSITVGYAKTSWLRWRNRKNAAAASEEQMENFFEMHRSRFQELLKDLINHLQSGIGSLPKAHFDQLRERLFAELRTLETE